MKIAVYGGSFDPPHIAHVFTASYALAAGGFDLVLVVPVFRHAFEKPLAPFEHRLAMCLLAFEGLSAVHVSDVEASLPVPSYTVQLLERLATDHPDWTLRLLMGSDGLAETDRWQAFERVVALAPPFILTRKGHERPELGPCVLPEISSSRVRELFSRRGDSEVERELSTFVPKRVREYAESHALYAGAEDEPLVPRG